ncbi:uncharacterized protein HD556DRAFT_1534489 [Suillus plorans]|uniref:Uncharacterized protein n=1 Tax=Suillus plorans TaxID=116603 RepID=A0A9P7J1Z9_9AGAM|nr:uncharacterized protein HD556DRAFT_1534489 [Suillus plorans]KAG1799275.1 hypothetical protein HD556DRAFT_1534489 [Suillus plorans]
MDVHSRPESSLATPQLTSSSWLGDVPDQDSTRSSLQSCLGCLDRVHDRMDCVYKEFLEIRTRITELLVTSQSEITTVGGEGTLNSDMYSQAIVNDEPQTIVPLAFDELNAVSSSLTPPEFSVLAEPLVFQGQFSDLKYGPLGFGTSTLQEGLSMGTIPQNLLPDGTPGVVSYGLGVLGLLPQYDTYSDGKTLSESSTSKSTRRESDCRRVSVMKMNRIEVEIQKWLSCQTRFLSSDGCNPVEVTAIQQFDPVMEGSGSDCRHQAKRYVVNEVAEAYETYPSSTYISPRAEEDHVHTKGGPRTGTRMIRERSAKTGACRIVAARNIAKQLTNWREEGKRVCLGELYYVDPGQPMSGPNYISNVDGLGRVETGTANTMSFLCTTDHPGVNSCQIRQHLITIVKASAGLQSRNCVVFELDQNLLGVGKVQYA